MPTYEISEAGILSRLDLTWTCNKIRSTLHTQGIVNNPKNFKILKIPENLENSERFCKILQDWISFHFIGS